MDPLVLARLQFGLTSVYHFFFVPMTIGLGILVALLETGYVKTGDEKMKRLTKFWGKLFLINFAVGVVTGIVQEFQFGMNWSGYSRFVGDIFGAPLAIEALLAFFIESTFLGVWIFGWDKLSKKAHMICMWLVAISSTLSAFWILAANSFMQNPVGYRLTETRAEMTSIGALLTNPYLWQQFPHVITAALCTGSFFLLGISAYHIIKKKDVEIFRISFKYGAVVGLIAVLGVITVGHFQGQYLVAERPMKMAAAEAHWETEDPAAFVVIAGIDEKAGKNTWSVKIPGVLSFLSYNTFTGEVKGIHDLQAEMTAQYGEGDYVPPVAVNFWSFRFMVASGGLMLILSIIGLVFLRKKTLDGKIGYLKLLLPAMALPFIANSCGWILAEMGRQPWIVYGLQQVQDAVSPAVSAGEVLFTVIVFFAVYTVLLVADIYLITKYAKKGMDMGSDEMEVLLDKEGAKC